MGSFCPLSAFADLPSPPEDEQSTLTKLYDVDLCEKKVNLTPEEYKDRNGEQWVLPVVRQAELELIMDSSLTHKTSSLYGNEVFIKAAQNMLFGNPPPELRNRLASIQTVSGTGAYQIGARLLCDASKPNTVWMSDPTSASHHAIWDLVGGVQRCTYPYTLPGRSGIDFERMMSVLSTQSRRNDIIIIQVCAHDPSGIDPTPRQWIELSELCQRKGIVPFFDCAYQGFASGDPDADVWPIRCFIQQGLELCVAQSFSKNFGLYGERVGCFHAVLDSSDHREAVVDRLCYYQRGLVSTPPTYGANIVSMILTSEDLYRAWRSDLKTMTDRIKKLRLGLYNELIKRRIPGNWEYLLIQRGIFARTSLSKQHVDLLREDYHVYIMSTGRISLPGLNAQNIEWVADAISDVVKRLPLEEKMKL